MQKCSSNTKKHKDKHPAYLYEYRLHVFECMSNCSLLPVSKPLDLLQSFKANINLSDLDGSTQRVFTQTADRTRVCVSLSCCPVGCATTGLSDVCHRGCGLLVGFSDANDCITAHINEALSLVLIWILH